MVKKIYLFFLFFATLFQPNIIFAQKYVVGGDFDYAPFTFIDKSGKPSGLEIDVLEAISATSGIQLSFQLSSWENALSNIQSGETDIIVGIIFSEDREKFLDFTIPIHTEYYSIFIRKNLPFKNLSSLFDYKLVVLDKDASIEKYLIPMGLFKDYIVAQSLPEALSVIELGLADYVLAPNLLGLNTLENNNYENIEIKGPSIIPSIYCMAVRKGDTLLLDILNNGILELRRNGKLTQIQEKWKVLDEKDISYRKNAKFIAIVFAIAIILLIFVFIWVWLLRLQIKKKTESLNIKNQELQKSEEKFRIITENSSDVIWHMDSNFLLTYISPADERIRGFKKEEVIGKSLFSTLKPEGVEMIKEANKKRMINLSLGIRTPPATYELEQLCKDGRWVWIEATSADYYDRDGKISGYHGVSRDITERKKAELLLKDRERELRGLNSTKDKLFSIIAHDLRSPFNAILGLTELLIDNINDFKSAESEKYLRIIESSTKNTLVLLDNLLTWARSQTGNFVFNPEEIHLRVIISTLLKESKPIAQTKNISLKYIQTEDIEVYADENMLKTTLRNLISNAIKYTHSNGEIIVSAVRNQNNIEIAISDNGVGMSEETLKKIFDIDTNITTPGTANEKGSGLGLMLCNEFIEKHGGEIWVKSGVGKGSIFTISLPARLNKSPNIM